MQQVDMKYSIFVHRVLLALIRFQIFSYNLLIYDPLFSATSGMFLT